MAKAMFDQEDRAGVAVAGKIPDEFMKVAFEKLRRGFMTFFIPTQELNFLINKIQNVVPVKPAVPILANILMEVKEGFLTLTATDLTVGICCQTEVKMLQEGSIALPAKRFSQLVRELTAPQIQITLQDNQMMEIVSGTSKFRLHGLSGEPYPKLPDISEAMHFRISQKILKDLLYRVSFAIARDETRFVLTGALMRVANSELTLLGTDGKRLARIHAPIEIDPAFTGSYILPLKLIEELLKILGEEGNATLFLMQDKIAIETDETKIVSKLLAGEYPDVSCVIPEKSEATVTLHREELISLLRQVALFTADIHHSVKFTFSDGDLRLSANTSDIGEGKVNMPVNYRGPQVDIAFNPGFFLDILRHSKEETVTMGIIDAFNPGVITEKEISLSSPFAANPLFVIMPMRLSEEAPC
jgi:DNA polymerase III subunit beta